MRPVVSTCDGPTGNMSLLLETILSQLLQYVPAHLKSTEECVQILKENREVSPECILMSLDVVALYNNIPVGDGINAAMALLEEHEDDVQMYGLGTADVRAMLQYALRNNIFEFGKKQYRQLTGIAMGNHLAPPLAIIFMSRLEESGIASSPMKPSLYKRYVDDVFMLWLFGMKALSTFVEHMNNQHPLIRFTIEHSDNAKRAVDFLDLTISISPQCSLEWELFMKPSHSGVHLSYLSSVPMSTKLSVARNQFARAIGNSSGPEESVRSIAKIQDLLMQNDYPADVIRNSMEEGQRMMTRKTAEGPREKRKRQQRNRKTNIIKVPFINDVLAGKVSRRVRHYSKDVRIVFTSGPSLKRSLVRSSLCTPTCPRDEQKAREKRGRGRPMVCRACDAGLKKNMCVCKNVVYSMQCTICHELYVGETERPLRDRFLEHHREALVMAVKTPWGWHYRNEHQGSKDVISQPNFQPFYAARILGRESSLPSRKYMEAMEIRKRQPAINNDFGWRLSD